MTLKAKAIRFFLARVTFVTAIALVCLALGCVRKPYAPTPCDRPDLSGCVIDEVKVVGARKVPADDTKDKIASAPASRFLGGILENIPVFSLLDRITVDYERLDPYVLERDLARIERLYRARGYYEAHARAARTFKEPDGHVTVEIAVDEGPAVNVADVRVEWKDWTASVPIAMTRSVEDARRLLAIDKPFDEATYEDVKKKMIRAMTDAGFAYASGEGSANVDLVRHEARVVYTLELGPMCRFGKIELIDMGEITDGSVRPRLDLREGRRFSTAKIDDAQADLARLGVFGAIDPVPKLSPKGQPRDPVIPLTISAQQSKLRLFKTGIGAEVGSRVEVHGIIGWENKNFLGGLRYFLIDAKPGLVFYPMRIDTLFSQRPTNVLPEIRGRVSFRQPGAFEPRVDWVNNLSVAVYRPESPTSDLNTGGYVEATFGPKNDKTVYIPAVDNIIGYREYAGNTGFERYWLRTRIKAGIYYNAQLDQPFSYNQSELPLGYRRVLVLYPEANVSFDFRKDNAGKYGAAAALNPHSGVVTSIDSQFAVGGDVTDLRFRPELRLYIPISKRITLGARLTTGLLIPLSDYADSIKNPVDCAAITDPEARDACATVRAREQQLLQFRAFFSGGPSSNRGYPYNGVGPHEQVQFITQNANIGDVIATGGLTLWESSLELRVPLGDKLGTVVFVDGSDVTRQVLKFRLTAPHLSAGIGFRYETPLGPFRADLGYRIPCLQVIGTCDDVPADEGTAGTIFGLPLAFNLAIGEAF